MEKNKKIVNVVIAIIAIAVLVFITVSALKMNKRAGEISEQSVVELNNSIKSDTTTDITASLGNIDLEDTLDEDMSTIDLEIEKL